MALMKTNNRPWRGLVIMLTLPLWLGHKPCHGRHRA
jgi:hypothetical protein